MKKLKAVPKVISVMISVFLLLMGVGPFPTTKAAGSNSTYSALSSDVYVTTATTILSSTINFTSTSKVYVQSDGRYFPGVNAYAAMQLYLDGNAIGSGSIIDWHTTTHDAQHSFNCIAAVTVSPGSHTFTLRATPISGTFTVGADSNLCVMTDITANMQSAGLASDSPVYNFTTNGILPPNELPHSPLISLNVNNTSGPIIALGSARAYSIADGDMMLGIYKDGAALPNDQALWTVNDSFSACESQAPLYTHAYINDTGSHTISLDASEFPWIAQGENPTQYRVGAGSQMVVLSGQMKVSGSAPQSTALNNCCDWVNLGTGNGTPVPIATATINIPSGHNGVVMFMAKTRLQADITDAGGHGFLWIEIDGKSVSSCGVQQIVSGASESQRTLCASFLSAGSKALSVGNHTVTVYAKAVGSFKHLCAVKDLPLLWFDGQSGNPAPSGFTQTLPSNNESSTPTIPTFKWNSSSYATSYNLVVSPSSDLSSPVINQTGITSTSYTPSTALSYGTKYYWRVTAVNSEGSTIAANSNFSFTTANSTNLVLNPGFESGMTSWSNSGSNTNAAGIDTKPRTGNYNMSHWLASAYNVYTYQTITGLQNGQYTLKAWVRSDYGGLGTAYMDARDYGGTALTVNIPTTSVYTQIVIKNINVTNGQCTIGFYSNSPATTWYRVDDVEFYKQ